MSSGNGGAMTVLGGGSVLREPRRSEPGPGSRSPGACTIHGGMPRRAHRASMYATGAPHAGIENLSSGRSSKWAGSGVAVPARMPRANTAGVSRQSSSALDDITNIGGSRRIYGKASGKPVYVKSAGALTAVTAAPSYPAFGGEYVNTMAAAVPSCKVEDVRVDAARATKESMAASHAWTEDDRRDEKARTKAAEAVEGLADVEVDGPRGLRDYASEIFSQMFREEAGFLPVANYMDGQADINGKMRAILVDWLIEVHMKYRLRSETLFLTVNIIDRYLSRTSIVRKRLQLVGVVAMLIAAKFEEIEPPSIAEFVYITDNAYTKDDILGTECSMLSALDFQITAPTASHFFDRLQRANRCDETQREVVQYLLELATLDLAMIRHTPSHVVSAALLLSNELFGRCSTWPASMVVHTRHADHALRPCVEELRALLKSAPESSLQAVPKKYAQERYRAVSRIPLTSSGVFATTTTRRQAVPARGGA